jgi:hypothetical protein
MEQRLESGDELQVGPVRFTFEVPALAPVTATASEMAGRASSLSDSPSTDSQHKRLPYPLHFFRSTWGAVLVGVIVALLIALPLLVLLPEPRQNAHATDEAEQRLRNTVADNSDFLGIPSDRNAAPKQPPLPAANVQEAQSLNGPDPSQPPIPDSVEAIKSWIGLHLRGKTDNADVSVKLPSDPQESAWYIRSYNVAGKDPDKVYQLVREHLATADELLSMTDIALQRRGLGMALEAATRIMRTLKDSALATAICDAYVLSNIEYADDRNSESLNKENVLMGTIRIYHLAKDSKRQAIAYKLLIEHAPDKHVEGVARMRLEEFQRKNGQFEEAANNLKEIAPDSSVAGARRLIPSVQKELEKQNKQQEK